VTSFFVTEILENYVLHSPSSIMKSITRTHLQVLNGSKCIIACGKSNDM
jgi:hypothetical protein